MIKQVQKVIYYLYIHIIYIYISLTVVARSLHDLFWSCRWDPNWLQICPLAVFATVLEEWEVNWWAVLIPCCIKIGFYDVSEIKSHRCLVVCICSAAGKEGNNPRTVCMYNATHNSLPSKSPACLNHPSKHLFYFVILHSERNREPKSIFWRAEWLLIRFPHCELS